MTNKEIAAYYEGLEHNCINNFGGYTKEQIKSNTNHLLNDNDLDDDDDEFPFAEIDEEENLRIMNWEASGGPEDLFYQQED